MGDETVPLKTKLLRIRDYSDLILSCNEQQFKVHKAVVCAESPVMAAALKGGFKEAKSGVIDVLFDIESVRRLIEFMYTGDYLSHNAALDVLLSGSQPEESPAAREHVKKPDVGEATGPNTSSADPQEPSKSDQMLCHARVVIIADYYDVPALKYLSIDRLKIFLEKEWSAKLFCELLEEVIGSTNDRVLLRMLGAMAVEHIHELFMKGIFDEGGLARELAPYVLPGCFMKLKAAEAVRWSANSNPFEIGGPPPQVLTTLPSKSPFGGRTTVTVVRPASSLFGNNRNGANAPH
ncbi:hypothetical protein F4808DRAFT_443119 [Astrocystis sublimbata]|nr:hypothetical protein F4808DRAFT_443119 [Astrocystis sublimbata]